MAFTFTFKCPAGLSVPLSGGRGSNRSEYSSCSSSGYVSARGSLNSRVRANTACAQSTSSGASSINPSANSSNLTPRPVAGTASSMKHGTEESYDDAAAPPMHYQIGSLIEPGELCMYDGGYDYEPNAYQDWEEITSLLSFDGEEHKYVTRHIPGAHMRVEDMFASFDGDDFEAVLTVAHGGEPGTDKAAQETEAVLEAAGASIDGPAAIKAADAAAHLLCGLQDSSDDPEDLYLAVTRCRAAGLAAEAQKKKNPKPKKRKAPLGTDAGDAWMFQVPVTVAGQPKFLSKEQYEAAQRAMLPPLVQQGDANTTDAPSAAAQQQEVEAKPTEVIVVVVQRPDNINGAAVPAPHVVHKQMQQTAQAVTYHLPTGGMCSSSNGSRHAAAALVVTPGRLSPVSESSRSPSSTALPAAAAPEGLLGLTAAAAATVATLQVQSEDLRRGGRVLAAPTFVAPLPAATAVTGAGGVAGIGAIEAEEPADLDVKLRLPVVLFSDEDCDQDAVTWAMGGGAGVVGIGVGAAPMLASSGDASVVVDDAVAAVGAAVKGAVATRVSGVYKSASVKRQVGKLALRRALSKLKGSLI